MDANHKRPFAAFDIDGTVARTSLLQLVTREMVARGKLSVDAGHEIDVRLHDFRQKVADESFGEYMSDAVKILFSNLKELPVSEYLQIAEAVVNRSLSNTYVYTRQLMAQLKNHGYFLIAISGSEARLVDFFAKAMGFDASYGAVYYQGETVIDGSVEVLNHSKQQILSDMIQKYNLETKHSVAIGDTSSDIPMLEAAEQGIAFNPNQALFQTARERGWMVVIERKDMVYGLEPQNGSFVLKTTNV